MLCMFFYFYITRAHARAIVLVKLEKTYTTYTNKNTLLFFKTGEGFPVFNIHTTYTQHTHSIHKTTTSHQLVIHLSQSRSSQDPVDTTAWPLTSCKSSSQHQEHPDTHSLDSGGYFQSWIKLPLTKQNRLKHCFWACRVGSIYLETWTLQTPLSVELICTRLSDMLIPAEPGHADPLGI